MRDRLTAGGLTDRSAAELASSALALLEGAEMLARVHADPAPLHHAAASLRVLTLAAVAADLDVDGRGHEPLDSANVAGPTPSGTACIIAIPEPSTRTGPQLATRPLPTGVLKYVLAPGERPGTLLRIARCARRMPRPWAA